MKYYGYGANAVTPTDIKPSQNMDLRLQRLIVESQLEQERKDLEQESALSDAASDDENDRTGEERISSLPVSPNASELLATTQLQMFLPTSMEQVHAAYRQPPLDVNTELGEDTKHTLDKKV